jgi:hypothetical protein
MERELWKWSVSQSIWGLCQWNLKGSCRTSKWKRECFTTKAPLGDQGGALISWVFERQVEFLFIRRPCLLGNPRVVQKRLWVKGNSLHNGPVGEPGGEIVYRGL